MAGMHLSSAALFDVTVRKSSASINAEIKYGGSLSFARIQILFRLH